MLPPRNYRTRSKNQERCSKLQQTPLLIPYLSDIISLAAGGNHVLALSRQERIYAWGAREQVQVGLRVQTTRFSALAPCVLPIIELTRLRVVETMVLRWEKMDLCTHRDLTTLGRLELSGMLMRTKLSLLNRV
jgi:hypothetical protein